MTSNPAELYRPQSGITRIKDRLCRSRRAVPTGTVEGELMRSNLESRVGKSSWPNLVVRVDQNIEYPAAPFTDEMLVALDERIEMLRAPQHQHLELFVSDQFLQIAINRTKAYVGQTFAYFIVNLVGSRVGIIVLNRLPDNLQLFRISWLLVYLRHDYAVRSSTKDCRVSASMAALAW